MAKKNGKIELLRFVFAVSVVLYHCQRHYMDIPKERIDLAFFPGGYIGVEFFFLLAGFLMAKSISKKDSAQTYDLGLETVQFTWRKIKAILPWHFAAFGIMFAGRAILERCSFLEMCRDFLEMLPNLFLFDKAGFNFGNLNRVEWYITCMIFGVMILYPVCRRYYSMFVHVFAPVGGLLLLGYLAENFGSFSNVNRWNGFIFVCMIRAVAEISLGAVSFEISRALEKTELSAMKRKILTAAEIGCYLSAFCYIVSTMPHKYEIYVLLVLMIAIALTFSGKVYGNEIFNNPWCYFLGKASLPIYLSQVLPLDFVEKYLVWLDPWEQTITMLMLTFMNAALCAVIIKAAGNVVSFCKRRYS